MEQLGILSERTSITSYLGVVGRGNQPEPLSPFETSYLGKAKIQSSDHSPLNHFPGLSSGSSLEGQGHVSSGDKEQIHLLLAVRW